MNERQTQVEDRRSEATSTQGAAEEDRLQPLLGSTEADNFRGRWQSIQTTFVDEPQSSVEEADALVTELMEQLTVTFQEERRSLESQLRSEDVSTEDLRIALQRYRSFFERLLST